VHELDPVGHRRQVGPVTGVGEGIEHDDLVGQVALDGLVDEVGADEPGRTRDEHSHPATLTA
jgi:hypothetical protein